MSIDTFEHVSGDPNEGEPQNSESGDETNSPDNQEKNETQEELRRAQQELEDYKDRYLRTMAEMDNLRKRMAKERTDLLKYGAEAVLSELLPALDSLDKACADQGDDAGKSYVEGVLLVKKQLFDILQKHGLQPIESVGKPFDPNLHQAIQRIDADDVDEEVVHEEFAKGYLLHERLLRPSMVSVKVPTKK